MARDREANLMAGHIELLLTRLSEDIMKGKLRAVRRDRLQIRGLSILQRRPRLCDALQCCYFLWRLSIRTSSRVMQLLWFTYAHEKTEGLHSNMCSEVYIALHVLSLVAVYLMPGPVTNPLHL